MRVGIDLDGVCYDFAGSVREYLCNRVRTHKLADCPEATRWEFYEDWGLDTQAFLDTCRDAVNAGVIFSHGDPYPDVAEAFQIIRSAGHSIHIVTDRSFGHPGASQHATARWLGRHNLAYDSITYTPDKTIAQVDAMIDDKPENYAALAAAGVDTYLLTRPWNQHVEGAQRVLDLLHFAEVICP